MLSTRNHLIVDVFPLLISGKQKYYSRRLANPPFTKTGEEEMKVFGTFPLNAHILIDHFKVDRLGTLYLCLSGRDVEYLIKCLNLKLLFFLSCYCFVF